MPVRAKFKCVEKKIQEGNGNGNVTTIKLTPVYSADPNSENAKFWKYTPSGVIEFGCVNESANEQFVIGQQYYVDFTPAPAN